MKRDAGEGPFTAHNWTWDRYVRRIHGAAEDRAEAEGRPYSPIPQTHAVDMLEAAACR